MLKDPMYIRNGIDEAIHRVKQANPTDKNHPYDERTKLVLKHLREAKKLCDEII